VDLERILRTAGGFYRDTKYYDSKVGYKAAAALYKVVNDETPIKDLFEPSDAKRFLINWGNACQKLERFDEEIEVLDQLIELDPNNAVFFNDRGYSKIWLGQYEEAILDFDRAVEVGIGDISNLEVVYANRGFSKMRLGHYEEAILDFDRAVEVGIEDISILIVVYPYRGFSKMKLGLYEEAIEDFNRLIELDSSFKVAFNNSGLSKKNLGLNEEAIIDFDKAVELDPEFYNPYTWRGEIFYEQGKKEEAVVNYQTSFNLLKDVSVTDLKRNQVEHLIISISGLVSLGFDYSSELEKYQAIAEERGYNF